MKQILDFLMVMAALMRSHFRISSTLYAALECLKLKREEENFQKCRPGSNMFAPF